MKHFLLFSLQFSDFHKSIIVYVESFTTNLPHAVIDLIYVTTKKEDLLAFPVF